MDGKNPLAGRSGVGSGLFREKELAGAVRCRRRHVAAHRNGCMPGLSSAELRWRLAAGGTAPRLAGQSYEYLVEAMRRFAEGERTNNADMMKIMKAISPADREAMARYISGL